MKKLIIVTSLRGGVGKTFLSAHLTEYYRALGKKMATFEIEPGKQSLSRFLENVRLLEYKEDQVFQNRELFDDVFLDALHGDGSLVDLGANTTRGILSWCQQITFIEMCKENGILPILLYVVPAVDKEAVDEIEEWVNYFNNEGVLLIGRTLIRGETFSYFEKKNKIWGFPEFKIPKIPEFPINWMLEKGLTFRGLVECDTLNILQKQRAKTIWMEFVRTFSLISVLNFPN